MTKVIESKFTCEREGLTIRGAQYLPVDFTEQKKYPAVIVSHGFTGNYMENERCCRNFAEIGYVAFSFSFCGGCSLDADANVKSDGKTTDMTIWTEVKDLIAVKNYVVKQTFIDVKNLTLLGFSQGGFISGLVAAECKQEIRNLIMVYPALCIPEHARRGCLAGASYDPENVPEWIDCGSTILGKNFHDTIVTMDPYLELSAYQGKVLILQGLEDNIVNYTYALRAKENYKKGQCHLQLIRNLGHGFVEEQWASAFASIRQFLDNKEEILTIRVIITNTESENLGVVKKINIYFTGYCETKYFQGIISPMGCDAQEYNQGVQTKMRAEYTLTGMDCNGKKCMIHIVNQKHGADWKPVIETNSEALAWMQDTDMTAVLEQAESGPTVRIFANVVTK